MENRRHLPIGLQSFRNVRNRNCVYVDKTRFVWELANDNHPYFLSRPRRFGKSLLISTMECYFLAEKELFKGLAIEDLEQDWVKYPVLKISFGETIFENSLILKDFKRFPSICGISETELEENFQTEIEALAEEQKLSLEETKAKLAKKYDEYHFSADSEGVYNPFCLLECFQSRGF